jgi:hypothetical protein
VLEIRVFATGTAEVLSFTSVKHSWKQIPAQDFDRLMAGEFSGPKKVVDAPVLPQPSTVDKAVSWIKAEFSRVVEGPVTGDALQARLDACRACDQLDAREAPQVGCCKACGCGPNARAELTVKATMPAATCPKSKWAAL